jgi:hypothetical protein
MAVEMGHSEPGQALEVLERALQHLMITNGFRLSSEAEDVLGQWFDDAARLTGYRQLPDDSIARAQDRLTTLLDAALGRALREALANGELGDEAPLVEAHHLFAVRRGLCPGFWPFC